MGLMDTVVVADSDSLWLLVGGIAMVVGLAVFAVNVNIRRNRKAAEEQGRALQREVRRLQKAQGNSESIAATTQREALAEALRRHPELSDTQDPDSVKRLQAQVDEIKQEIDLRNQVAALKAEQEEERRRAEAAEEAERKIEEGARKAEALRQAEAERRIQAERDREVRIAGMSAPRRFLALHPGLARVALVGAVVVAAGAIWGITQVVIDSRERAAAEAQAAEEERAAAEAQVASQAAAEKERQRLAQLPTACDLTTPEADITNAIWLAWLTCADETVVAEAAVRADLRNLSGAELTGIAETTNVSALATRISILMNTPMRAHKILVERWGPEAVGDSYKIVYKQECTEGVRPQNYLGGTTWETDSGDSVEFLIKDCVVRGYPDTTIRGAYDLFSVYSNTRWSQGPDGLWILSGRNYYEGDGSSVYRLIKGGDDAPKTLTRTQ